MRPHLNERIYFQSKLGVNLAGFQSSECKVCLHLRMKWVMGGCRTSPRHAAMHSSEKQTAILQNIALNKVLLRLISATLEYW